MPNDRIVTKTFLVLAAYGMLALGLSLMLVTGLPLYLQTRGWQPGQMGTVLGAYFLTSLLVRPFVGREADRRGHKLILVVGAALMLVASPFYLLSDSAAMVLVLRIVQGVGWAMATTATAALASQIIPQDRLGTGMGIFGILNGLGFTFGPALGAYLLNTGGGVAFILAAVGLASAVLICALVIRPPAAQAAPAISWSDARDIVRQVSLPLLVTLAVCFGYGAVQTFLPLYARAAGVVNPGVFFTVFSVLTFVSRPAMGKLSDVWGRRSVAAILMVIIASTFSVLAYSASSPFLISAAVLYGIGHGAIFTVLMALLADLTPPKQRGLTYGVFGTAIDLGITVGTFTFGMLVGPLGYQASFLTAAVIVLVALPLLAQTKPAAAPVAGAVSR
jgi:MFS family permease